MKLGIQSILEQWRVLCIKSVLFAQRHVTALMFIIGVILLGAGLTGLSNADINEPEGADADFNRGAPGAFNRFPLPAFARAPQAAIAEAPQAALAADPEVGVPNPAIGGEEAIDAEPENLDGPYDDTLQRNAVGNLFKFMEGSFGALVMTVAGIGAIIAASMGAYKAAVGIMVVAIGAFILRALVSLFFGTDYEEFGGLNGGGGGGAVGALP